MKYVKRNNLWIVLFATDSYYSEYNKLLAGPTGPDRKGESYSNGHSSVTYLHH